MPAYTSTYTDLPTPNTIDHLLTYPTPTIYYTTLQTTLTHQTLIEPAPHLPYHLLHNLISLSRTHDPRALKRFDYLADGRKNYYIGHDKFQTAYRALSSAAACAATLDKKWDHLAALSLQRGHTDPDITRQLSETELARRANNEEMNQCLKELERRQRARQEATRAFSEMKMLFLEREMGHLLAVGKQQFLRGAKGKGEVKAAQTSALPPRACGKNGICDANDDDDDDDDGGTVRNGELEDPSDSEPDFQNGADVEMMDVEA